MEEDKPVENKVMIETASAAAAASANQDVPMTSPEEEKSKKELFEEKKKAWQAKKIVEVQRVDAEGNSVGPTLADDDAKDAA